MDVIFCIVELRLGGWVRVFCWGVFVGGVIFYLRLFNKCLGGFIIRSLKRFNFIRINMLDGWLEDFLFIIVVFNGYWNNFVYLMGDGMVFGDFGCFGWGWVYCANQNWFNGIIIMIMIIIIIIIIDN
jgi:hypothetical protein